MTELNSLAEDTDTLLLNIRPSRQRIRAVRRGRLSLAALLVAGGAVRALAFGSRVHDAALWTALLILGGGGLLVGAVLVS